MEDIRAHIREIQRLNKFPIYLLHALLSVIGLNFVMGMILRYEKVVQRRNDEVFTLFEVVIGKRRYMDWIEHIENFYHFVRT